MKRIFAIFMAALLCLPLAILPLSAAGSSEGSASTYDVKTSSAFDDLATVFVDGVKKVFSTEDEAFSFFSKSTPGEISMVTLAEHGVAYGDLETSQRDYGLYVYVSSDLGCPFNLNVKPTITIATEFEKRNVNGVETSDVEQWLAMDYDEYTMTYVGEEPSASNGRGLYKFKVDINVVTAAFLSGGDSRRYDIGALGFVCKDVSPGEENTPTIIINTRVSVPVGTSYVCTGYRDGYRNGYTGGNFRMTTTAKEVVEFDVQQAAFRYENNDSIDQITSVYFAVDNKYLEKYGYISAIKASWDERRTTPIVVTNDEALWNEYTDNGKISDNGLIEWGSGSIIGKDPSLWGREIERSLYSDSYSTAWAWYMHFAFNRHGGDFFRTEPPVSMPENETEVLSWLFYKSNLAWDSSLDMRVSSEELLSYRDAFLQRYPDSEELLYTNDVGEGRVQGKQTHLIYEKDFLELKGFEYNLSGPFAKWFKALLGLADDNDDLSANAIQSVGADEYLEMAAMSEEDVSKKYFVADYQVSEFRNFCQQAVDADKTVILFHFAKTDYYASPLIIWADGLFGRQEFGGGGYVAQENVFLDFDVIHLQFTNTKTNVDTVIPVSMEKTDIVPDIEPPKGLGDHSGCNEEFGNTIKGVLGIVVVLVLIVAAGPAVIKMVFALVNGIIDLFTSRRRK